MRLLLVHAEQRSRHGNKNLLHCVQSVACSGVGHFLRATVKAKCKWMRSSMMLPDQCFKGALVLEALVNYLVAPKEQT